MAVKISKRYASHSYNSFSAKLFLKIPCDSPYKLTSWHFAISNLIFSKKD